MAVRLAVSSAALALIAAALGAAPSSARVGDHAAFGHASSGKRLKTRSRPRKFPKLHRVPQVGGAPCEGGLDPSQGIVFENRAKNTLSAFKRGTAFFICFPGFDATDETMPINATVTLPNGHTRSNRITGSPASWLFLASASDPVGQYRVTATGRSTLEQGGAQTQFEATFTILRRHKPSVDYLLRTSIQPGGSVPVVLSGFRRRERVDVRLYSQVPPSPTDPSPPPQITYQVGPRVARIRVNKRGFALRSVVAPSPPAGSSACYVLAVGPVFGPDFLVTDGLADAACTGGSPS